MKYEVSERLIWLNGELKNVNDAKINVLSPTAQFGLNAFEGIPCYYNEETGKLYAFRLEDHYKRLMKSAKLLQIDCPYSLDELKKAFIETIQANEYRENLSVRQTLFVEGFGSWGSEGPTGMFVAPIPRGNTSAEYNKKGLNICISSYRRISEDNLSPGIKCGANYMNSRVGQREALRNGYDTCVFLNEFGKVSEGPGSCFFMIKDKEVMTPLLTDSVLKSITRDSILKIADNLGYKAVERTIDRTELYTADEAFLCGSAMELTPIVSVDKVPVVNSYGESISNLLHKEYLAIAKGQQEKFQEWITEIK